MRLRTVLSLLLLLTILALAQTPPPVEVLADKLVHDGAVLRATGHVRTKIGDVAMQSDDATYNSGAAQLELRGHVHVALPGRSDHFLFRYGGESLVTDQAVVLTANQMTWNDGKLQASGSVVAIFSDPDLPGVQLRSDELTMDLKVADATMRGNIRTINRSRSSNGPQFIPRPFFPPDIIR